MKIVDKTSYPVPYSSLKPGDVFKDEDDVRNGDPYVGMVTGQVSSGNPSFFTWVEMPGGRLRSPSANFDVIKLENIELHLKD